MANGPAGFPPVASRAVSAFRAVGIRSERALIGLDELDLDPEFDSYGQEGGPLSASVVTTPRMDRSPARPTAVMSLIDDRRRRSRME